MSRKKLAARLPQAPKDVKNTSRHPTPDPVGRLRDEVFRDVLTLNAPKYRGEKLASRIATSWVVSLRSGSDV